MQFMHLRMSHLLSKEFAFEDLENFSELPFVGKGCVANAVTVQDDNCHMVFHRALLS